jgi:chemotaxis protein MotB
MKPTQPIIIVKKNRGGHAGHHGGAWKVAYADFVTAMMAFFLVMWLVGASPDVKKSVAGYFREPGVFDFERSTGMMAGGMSGIDEGRAPETAQQPDAAALTMERRPRAAARPGRVLGHGRGAAHRADREGRVELLRQRQRRPAR